MAGAEPFDQDPRRWRRLALVSVALLLAMSAWFTATAVSASFQSRWALGAGEVAWLTTVVQIGFVVGTALAALLNLADVWPSGSYFAASAFLAAVANAALLVAPSFESALGLRFLTGLFLAGVYPPAMKMMATWFRSARGLAIGTVVGALTVGKAAPYLLRALGGASSAVPVVLGASAGAVVAGFLILVGYDDGPYRFARRPFEWRRVGRVIAHRPTMLATGGYLGHMWELYAGWLLVTPFFAAVYAARGAASPEGPAALWGFAVIAVGGVGAVVAGMGADRWGRERVANGAMAISGLCSLTLGWLVAAPLWVVGPLALVWGLTIVADSAQFSAVVTEVAPRDSVGTALTLQTMLGFALTGVSMQLGVLVVERAGWGPGLSLLALGPVAGIASMRRLRRHRRGPDRNAGTLRSDGDGPGARTRPVVSAPRYRSTRGHGPVDLSEALVRGLAPDGGLYWPERVPRIALPEPGPLTTVGPRVVAPFLPGGSEPWVHDAFSFDTPLDPLDRDRFLLDLTGGPTAAFKDVGARFLARALAALSPVEAGGLRTVLVATSGDTGGAVAAAFQGIEGLRVVVLFPADGVSPRQRRQFTTLGDSVMALGVDGPFDECQRLVKEALGDDALVAEHRLTSANSINVGRLLPQASWYVKALADLEGHAGPPTFVVPSGNLGNLTAGLLAATLVDRDASFVAAVNDNDAFVAWYEGRSPSSATTIATPSTAMDVGRPGNLERIAALDRDDPGLRRRLTALSISAADTLEEMARRYRDEGRFVDPHTAVGLAALRRLDDAGRMPGPAVVLSTAHAGKFPETVRAATGVTPPVPPALAGLDGRRERWSPMPPHLAALREALAGSGGAS